jgi:hypothetical protein
MVCVAHAVNSLGLIFDIAGVIIIWLYGLPPQVDRAGAQHLITEQVDEQEREKAARYDRYSRYGLALLIAGFVFQLVSNWL